MGPLKLLKITDDIRVRGFVREAKTAMRLRDRRIADVYDAGDFKGQFFIAMQLIRGETLERQIGGDLRDVVQLVRDAAEAVHHAHEQGFVHRDIKPGNIMVEARTGSLYVLDFGIAKWLGAGTSEREEPHGTPLYMAPEQIDGERIDHRADIFALGATLYHLITGRPYIDLDGCETSRVMFERIRNGHVMPPSNLVKGVDADLDATIMRCLAKDPARRFASADKLARALDRFLEATAPARPPALEKTPRTYDAGSSSIPADVRYSLKRRIGGGGFAEVWEAWDGHLNATIALKLVRPPSWDDTQQLRMRRRTVDITSLVRHPVLLPILDCGALAGGFFTTMPLLRGPTLDRSALPVVEKIRLVRDVALAVHAVHCAGFHRLDIKPSNLIVDALPDQPAAIYWLDLDLALGSEDEFTDGAVAGTPAVMAPEQARGERGDARIDIYALGATLYHAIAGRYPIESGADGYSLGAHLAVIMNGDIEPLRSLANVDDELDWIVGTCLATDPGDRHRDAATLGRVLTRYLSGSNHASLSATLTS